MYFVNDKYEIVGNFIQIFVQIFKTVYVKRYKLSLLIKLYSKIYLNAMNWRIFDSCFNSSVTFLGKKLP